MNDPALRDWRIGYDRLLASPHDLRICGGRIWPMPEGAPRSAEHRRLFAEYRGELANAVEVATKWWDRMIAHQLKRIGSRDDVVRSVWNMFPAGPSSEPAFISVIRKYWLACDELSRAVPDDERVSPEVFLLRWLEEAGEREFVRMIAYLPYWPIGMDRDGNWV